MDIMLQSSDLYSRYLRITIRSIMNNANQDDSINFHILSDGIRENNRKLIQKDNMDNNRFELYFYDADPYKRKIEGVVPAFHGSVSTYLKLFVEKILPQSVDRVLYLDVDLIVLGSLKELFELDMGQNYMMGVRTLLNKSGSGSVYVNGGVQLINLRKYRENGVSEMFLREMQLNGQNLMYADQSVVHNTIPNFIGELHLKYNLVTPCQIVPRKRLQWLYNINDYYTDEVYSCAQKNPVICHCTEWVVGRPWFYGSRSPYSRYYRKLVDELNINYEWVSQKKRAEWLVKGTLYKYAPKFILRRHIRKVQNNKQGVIDEKRR